jgi:hypothetical protein
VLDNDIKEKRREGEAKKRTGRKKVCFALGNLTTDDGGGISSSSIFYSAAMLFVGNERECAHTYT